MNRKGAHGAAMNRRRFLWLLSMSGGLLAAACRQAAFPLPSPSTTPTPKTPQAVSLTTPTRLEKERTYTLEVVASEMRLDSQRFTSFTYSGTLPGPELRVREGERLRVTVSNRLPEPTTIHWHGIPVPHAMDGVPDVTQPAIQPGESFTYDFVVPIAGTYFYHTHVGLQLDRGLYGALIVEPAQETVSYDREYTLLLDDWLDGLNGTPEDALQQLVAAGHDQMGHGMHSMPMMPGMGSLPMMPGMTPGGYSPAGPNVAFDESAPDLVYPLYLINGQPPESPFTFEGQRGEVLRLRLINAASATIFRVALVGHRLRVTHADGQPVDPREGEALRIGMGEWYDVLVQLDNPGVWPLVAWAEGTSAWARAILRYQGSRNSPPPLTQRPKELAGQLLHGLVLRTAPSVAKALPTSPDRELPIILGGGMGDYRWTINGQAYPDADPIVLQRSQHVRFRLHNMTTMPHPMHLHGHFFWVRGRGSDTLRDTILLDPMQEPILDWVADNPGQWAFHCHHLYHMETGMMRVIVIQ